MEDLFSSDESELEQIGYRVQKVQLKDWGTFDSSDGRVHTIDPAGNTTLLIGRNGTGKSTLVDAILTLLTPPQKRSYNIAAGSSGKRERDEKTYIQGAYGHTSSNETHRAQTQYLRPGRKHYTVVLAQFHNAGTGKSFTLAQLLYLNSQEKPERLYCWSDELHTIESSFADIITMERLAKQVKERGFEVSQTFPTYRRWLMKTTGMADKALDVFNQTVAVKEIHSLDEFIRTHMLQKKNWKTIVNNVLVHFDVLTQSYDALVKARMELELLIPVEKSAAKFNKARSRETEKKDLQRSVPYWFAHQTQRIIQPQCREWQRNIESLQGQKDVLDKTVDDLAHKKAELELDIKSSGDARLASLRSTIERKEAELKPVTIREVEVKRALGLIHAGAFPVNAGEWGMQQNELDRSRSSLSAEKNSLTNSQATLSHEILSLKGELEDIKREYHALMKRRTQLPESYQQLRNELCIALTIAESDLPYAAELMAVSPQSYAWESSIEKVLRTMALTLLVPEDLYHKVSHYIDSSSLKDHHGKGMRLHYERISTDSISEPEVKSKSLMSHLEFKGNHGLSLWLKHRIATRFHYRCCESVEEFQNERGAAMTVNRHIKHNFSRHEKDDRSFKMVNYVLGWDNARKIDFLKKEVTGIITGLDEKKRERANVETRINQVNSSLEKIRFLLDVKFVEFDVASLQDELKQLRDELQLLEQSDQKLQRLKIELEKTKENYLQQNTRKEALIGEIANKVKDLKVAEGMLKVALEKIEEVDSEQLETLEGCFSELLKWIGDEEFITLQNLSTRENEAKQMAEEALREASKSLGDAQTSVIKSMGAYLRKFPEQETILSDDVESLPEFLTKLNKLKRQDLPKHEQRFKDHLNEKVKNEIAILNSKLREAERLVEKKISQLNKSLGAISDAGKSYMELDAIRTKDREIIAFKQGLNECLSGTLLGDGGASEEARYKTIAKFIRKLKEEERWRDRVIDVRRWFHFAVTERDAVDRRQIGYHTDSGGKSGGEKARLAFTILVAAIAYQFNIDPSQRVSERFHFVMVDEMFSKVDDKYAEYALNLFKRFGLQLLIVAPFDAKARITEPYVKHYLHVMKNENHSNVTSMKAEEVRRVVKDLESE